MQGLGPSAMVLHDPTPNLTEPVARHHGLSARGLGVVAPVRGPIGV
jgi:hypothetical protein